VKDKEVRKNEEGKRIVFPRSLLFRTTSSENSNNREQEGGTEMEKNELRSSPSGGTQIFILFLYSLLELLLDFQQE